VFALPDSLSYVDGVTYENLTKMLEAADIPCGPINTLDKVFTNPQVAAREMLVTMEHSTIGDLPLIGSPLKFSQTPVEYRLPPPRLGEHTEEILREVLGRYA